MPKFSIGVDLGGTNLRIAAVDEHGTLLERVSLSTDVSLGPHYVIKAMCESIRQLDERYRPTGELAGIGIGVPGIIDPETALLREAENLPGWAGVPVQAEIERQLGTRVVLENDANAAALGEKWLGAARDFDDIAMLTLGTGVGGGLILGGKIWRGMSGMAGEFGHMTIDWEGIPCSCGSRGCLEQYGSATAIIRIAKDMARKDEASEIFKTACSAPDFNAKCVYDLAAQGDQQAQEIFHSVGRSLGIAIADLVNAMNLPIYVIGGGVSGAWDAFAPSLFEELRQRSAVYAATEPSAEREPSSKKAKRKTLITRALLGGEGGLYGAARLPVVSGL
jgi:glucokinase